MPLRIVGIDLALPSAVFPGGVAGDKEDGGPANVVLWRGTIHHLGRADVTGRDPTEHGPKSLAGEGRLAAIDQNSQAGGAGQREGITLIAHAGEEQQRLIGIGGHATRDQAGQIINDPSAG